MTKKIKAAETFLCYLIGTPIYAQFEPDTRNVHYMRIPENTPLFCQKCIWEDNSISYYVSLLPQEDTEHAIEISSEDFNKDFHKLDSDLAKILYRPFT